MRRNAASRIGFQVVAGSPSVPVLKHLQCTFEPAGRIEDLSAEEQDQEAVGQGDGPRQPEAA